MNVVVRPRDFVHFSSEFHPRPGWLELRIVNVARGLVEPEVREQSARHAILQAIENWKVVCYAARDADLVLLHKRIDLIVDVRDQPLADSYAKEFERFLNVELVALGLKPNSLIAPSRWRWPHIDPLVHDMKLAAASVENE